MRPLCVAQLLMRPFACLLHIIEFTAAGLLPVCISLTPCAHTAPAGMWPATACSSTPSTTQSLQVGRLQVAY